MKKFKITLLFLGLFAIYTSDLNAQSKPNVIVIMTDDVGWGDLGCYGGGVMRGAPTPNLDRMAAEGTRFANYYGQSSCTAGRASFITGRIPVRSALSAVLVPGDPNGLSKETPTIAEAMKKAGYSTLFIGKWHLGDKEENYPIAHGYDEMYHMLPHITQEYTLMMIKLFTQISRLMMQNF